MAAHAKKSASGSKRWIECPGSLAYVASLPDHLRRPTNEAAMTGTCAHALGEHCLNEGLREVPAHLMGRVIYLDQDEDAFIDLSSIGPERSGQLDHCETRSHVAAETGADVKFMCRVDEKMVEGVQLYLDTVWGDLKEMGGSTEMWVERRFDLTWLRPDMFGTADCTLYELAGLLRVIDYKNGYVGVDAEGNTQGLYYALGMAHEVEWAFDRVEVVIVQPNSQDGRTVKRFELTRAELEEFSRMLAASSDHVDEATEALERCEDEVDFIEWCGSYLSTGKDGDHCTFCDALAVCPAAKMAAQLVAQHDFADAVPEENEMSVTDGKDLERLQQVLEWAPFLDKMVSAAKELGQRRLEQGLEMPGFKLVAGKANRVYAVDDDTIKERMKAAGFDEEQVLEPVKDRKVKSPAQLEKLGKKAKELVNGVAEETEGQEVRWKVEPLAIKPQGKLAMAPLSDPRPAVTVGDAADDFAGVME